MRTVQTYYDSIGKAMDDASWYTDEDIFAAVYKLIPTHTKSVLELCCGAGRLLQYIKQQGEYTKIVGADISETMVAQAQQRLGNSVYKSDWIQHIPLRQDELFDVVVVKNAFHLLQDIDTKMNALLPITSKNANVIIIETVSPDLASNNFVKEMFARLDPNSPKKHYFTVESFREKIQQSEWIIDKEVLLQQCIDVVPWLDLKCSDAARKQSVAQWLAQVSKEIRTAMLFTPHNKGQTPQKMLRLQMVAVCKKKS